MPGITVQEAADILFGENGDEAGSVDTVFIAPPDPDVLTDEDSGDEDEGGVLDNLNPRQLSAQAEIRYHDERDDESNTFHRLPPSAKRTWIHGNMESFLRPFPDVCSSKYQDFSIVELFELFIDDDLVNYLVQESNKYAIYKNNENPHISKDELKCFLGILILSGYNSVPNKRLYWENRKDTRHEFICNAIRRNRFEQILRFLHCADNNEMNVNDKLWKIRPLVENIRKKCLQHFISQQDLSYDESMVKYYGKHSCKQFIRGKPIRFGYKVWSLCSNDGYLVNFNIYQGKSPSANNLYENNFGKAAAPLIQMVDDFSEGVKFLPYHFFFDNLFTGLDLLAFLREKGYGGTGTIRENRIPKTCPIASKNILMKEERGYHETSIAKEDGVLVSKWVDNSVVAIASNCLGVEPQSGVKRYSQKEKRMIQVQRPHLIGEYNRKMGGVDRMDQNIAMYRVNIRNKKWYWPLLSWCLDVCVHNAWQLGRRCGKKISQLEFRREIVLVYLTKYANPSKGFGRPSLPFTSSGKCRTSTDIRFDGINHLVKKIQKKRRCAGDGCLKKSSAVRTQCNKCDVGLCLDCFESYHTGPK